jgi:hypothetical protein
VIGFLVTMQVKNKKSRWDFPEEPAFL